MKYCHNKTKYLISFIIVVVLCASITVPVFADFRSIGAGIMAALAALNITIESTVADLGNSVIDFMGLPQQTITSVDWSPYYTDWTDYLDKSEIIISDDVTTIDGVDYRNVWLSHDAADKFRTDAFDFKTAYALTSNSNGNLASGYGTFDGIPVFRVNGRYVTQNFYLNGLGSYSIGNASYTLTTQGTNRVLCHFVHNSSFSPTVNTSIYTFPYKPFDFNSTTAPQKLQYCLYASKISNGTFDQIGGFDYTTDNNINPFEFDWVSTDIPVESELPENHGLNFYAPVQVINNYNLSPGSYPIDYDTGTNTDVGNSIGNILPDVTLPSIELPDGTIVIAPVEIKPTFGPQTSDPSTPDVPVVPDTVISLTPYQTLKQDINRIIENIQEGRILQQTYWNEKWENTIAPFFKLHFEELETWWQTIMESINPIKQNIDKIKKSLDDLPDNLERHLIDTLGKGIDALKVVFLSLLGQVKSFLGIWHYVVEWLQSIAIPFALFIGFLQNMSYTAILPLYACIAGTIVIAVYKRFGR